MIPHDPVCDVLYLAYSAFKGLRVTELLTAILLPRTMILNVTFSVVSKSLGVDVKRSCSNKVFNLNK